MPEAIGITFQARTDQIKMDTRNITSIWRCLNVGATNLNLTNLESKDMKYLSRFIKFTASGTI